MASDNKRGRSGSEPSELAEKLDTDEIQQPPSKKRRTVQLNDEHLQVELDDGEVPDMDSKVNSRETSSPAPTPPPHHLGWNAGVKPAGLRTSFGSRATSAISKQVTVPTNQEEETSSVTTAAQDPPIAEAPLSKSAAKKRRRAERQAAAAADEEEWLPSEIRQARAQAAKKAAEAGAAAATVAGEQPSSGPAEAAPLPKKGRRARAKKAAEAAAATAAAAANGTQQLAPADVKEEPNNQQAVSRKQRNRRYKFCGQTWQLPSPPGPEWGFDESRTWQFKFEQWVQDFIALNNDEKHLEVIRDPKRVFSVLQDGYGRWQVGKEWKKKAGLPLLDYRSKDKFPLLVSTIEHNLAQGESMSPMPPLSEPGVPATRSKAEGAVDKDERPGVNGVASTALEPAVPDIEADATSSMPEVSQENSRSSKSSGEISEHTEDLQGHMKMEDADEKAFRERYYPGIADDQVFCISCATFGHSSHSCPEANCRFCGNTEHMGPGCPTRQRCSKCKQLGHVKETCREKLALAPGEGMECAFCASNEHTESDCTEFFRTYRPSPETIHKVKHIPIFCYCCGNEGHYGTICGLNPAPTKTAFVEIWSKENWEQYVDPNSNEEAIAWDSAAGGNAYAHDANGRPDFGKSIVPRTHIIFEDDDEDDEEGFIRPPVQRQQQNGQINVSRQGRGGFSSLAQQARNPPLPPGPPPGLPARPPQPNGRRPRKPKPSQQHNQGRGNGQQNGRGGGSGGGGGGFRIRGGATRARGGRR
ncbi:hypothetical protein BR93DRAFT_975085 [Coniochaeta sp. PMI_546]|nr:hypothetical protein BR93DRAFT_975085 [Coniochaeta sp. PMI_546]